MTEAGAEERLPEPEPAQPPGAGGTLRAARERAGLSAADVARHLRMSLRQVEALEAEEFGRLPGGTFLRGFIRNYARLVQLDPEPLLAMAQAAGPAPGGAQLKLPESKEIPFPSGARRSRLHYLAGAAVVALALALLAYELYRDAPPAKVTVNPVAAPAAPAPVATGTPVVEPLPAPVAPAPQAAAVAEAAAPAPPATGPDVLHFRFEKEAWVEVRDRRDRVIFYQLNPAGSEQRVAGEPPYGIVIGNATHVRLSFRDQAVDLAPHTKVEVARLTLE